MMEKLNIAFRVIAILFAGFGPWHSATAQTAPAASLENQLKEHYKLTKTGTDSTGLAIVEPGTVLVIRKGGILGVPPTSSTIASSIYKDGELHSPDGPGGGGTRFLPVGEKVYITKIDVALKSDKVAVEIIECDSCNGAQKPSFYKSVVVFQFPKDYLTGAAVDQIEDVISQVFPEPPPAGETPGGFSNDDVIRMVRAKLPDLIVIKKIKSSTCDFDTSPDALIKLKVAGVSDSVLQIMVEVMEAATPPPPPPPPPPDQQPTCENYDACMKIAGALLESSQWDRALARFQEASQLDPSRGDAWAGMGSAYFQMGQYDDATVMADKALQLGSTLRISVCHAKAACGDTGTFLLSMKEVSFVSKKGEKEFAAAPSAVTSFVCGILSHDADPAYYQAYCLQIRFAEKNYRFYYLPKGVQCSMGFICPEPGLTQQKGVANYVHERLVRIAAGDFGSLPNKP